MPTLILTKHHGLGNDFLVLQDTDDEHGRDAGPMAAALCDRRRGIGADGLIRLGPDLTMELHNADGSPAEMSGNGIRCLAQAIVDNGVHGGPEFQIRTDAGARWVVVHPEKRRGLREVTVEMGPVRVTTIDAGCAEVDTGNPHLVLFDTGQDLARLGRQHPDVNVELIRTQGSDLVMRVHERGAGMTEACGTGSCAAAAAGHEWGLVGDRVTVHNPGGDLLVELKPEGALLTGPAQFVGRIEVSWP